MVSPLRTQAQRSQPFASRWREERQRRGEERTPGEIASLGFAPPMHPFFWEPSCCVGCVCGPLRQRWPSLGRAGPEGWPSPLSGQSFPDYHLPPPLGVSVARKDIRFCGGISSWELRLQPAEPQSHRNGWDRTRDTHRGRRGFSAENCALESGLRSAEHWGVREFELPHVSWF